MVCHPARLHPAHDRALQQVPVPHRRGARAAQHALGTGAAPLHRKRLQPAGGFQRARRRHVAVHARDRHLFRAQAERLSRRPARRAGVHPGRAGLFAKAARHVRRLAPGAGCLQLGRRQRRPRHREEQEERPGHRLCRTEYAQRDPLLRAQAAGGEEHHRQPGKIPRRAAIDREPSVLPDGEGHARHRRRVGGQAGRRQAGRLQGAQSVDEAAGDPGRGHTRTAAAVGQRKGVRAQLRRLHQRPVRQLDGLERAGDHDCERGGAPDRDERKRTSQHQHDSAADADQGRFGAGRSAQSAAPAGRDQPAGRSRPTQSRAGKRHPAHHGQGRQARQRCQHGQAL